MNSEFNAYSKWIIKELCKWIVVTGLVTMIISIFLSNKIEFYEAVPFLLFQSVLIICLSVIGISDYNDDLWISIAVVSGCIYCVEFALLFSLTECLFIFFGIIITVIIFNRVGCVIILNNLIDAFRVVLWIIILVTGIPLISSFINNSSIVPCLCMVILGYLGWRLRFLLEIEVKKTNNFEERFYTAIAIRYIWDMTLVMFIVFMIGA